MDYFSRDTEIAPLTSTTSRQVISKLRHMFVRWGIRLELVSDNSTQFTLAEFQDFKQRYCFSHITSSPHYTQGNGAAERAVQTAKHILIQPDPCLAMMCYCSTPIALTGASPAQLVTGRQVHTTVPVLKKTLLPRPVNQDLIFSGQFYNHRHSARPFPEQCTGQAVRVKLDRDKGWKTPARVKILKNPVYSVFDLRCQIVRRYFPCLKSDVAHIHVKLLLHSVEEQRCQNALWRSLLLYLLAYWNQ